MRRKQQQHAPPPPFQSSRPLVCVTPIQPSSRMVDPHRFDLRNKQTPIKEKTAICSELKKNEKEDKKRSISTTTTPKKKQNKRYSS